jgi:hypothetical protein
MPIITKERRLAMDGMRTTRRVEQDENEAKGGTRTMSMERKTSIDEGKVEESKKQKKETHRHYSIPPLSQFHLPISPVLIPLSSLCPPQARGIYRRLRRRRAEKGLILVFELERCCLW